MLCICGGAAATESTWALRYDRRDPRSRALSVTHCYRVTFGENGILIGGIAVADLGAWSPADWSAAAAWVTVLIALVAAFLAFRQVGEARRLREAQAQPYVVAYMEPSAVQPQIINFVVKNFGSTVARNVRLVTSPSLQRSVGGAVEDVELFAELPTLVPGQSWQTMWDFGPERAQSDLPKRHEVSVDANDYRGRPLRKETFILDWAPYERRQWVTEHGVHDAAKALREIDRKIGRWQDSARGGLAVFVRDGDDKDRQERARMEEARRRHDELGARLSPPSGILASDDD